MRDHTPWPRYRHPRPGSPLTMGSPITDGEWAALNEKIRDDARVYSVLVSIGDGLAMAMKL